MQYAIKDLTILNNISIPQTSSEYPTSNGSNIVNIEIESDGTFSLQVEGKVNAASTIWKPIIAINISTLSANSTITNKNYAYQIDLTGFSVFRVNVTAVTGNLTVYGKVVG